MQIGYMRTKFNRKIVKFEETRNSSEINEHSSKSVEHKISNFVIELLVNLSKLKLIIYLH